MTTFEINNQVSGIYAGQAFSGKVLDVIDYGYKAYIQIQLDAAIEVWAVGTLTMIEMEIDNEGNKIGAIKGNVALVVVSGEKATTARERVVVKRAVRAGVTAEFAQMFMMRFDMTKWHHSVITKLIIHNWQDYAANGN